MRIGLLGGTFNPIQNGHLNLAQEAKKKLSLDKIIFIPAYCPPHKDSAELIDARDRFRMVEMAVSDRPGFEVSRYEIDKKQLSYSVDTLEYFKGSYPAGAEFYFLIGADMLDGLKGWKDIDKLFKLCKFAVFSRPGFLIDKNLRGVEIIDMAPVDISSTDIRRRIRTGKKITGLLPKAVEDYINVKNFYK